MSNIPVSAITNKNRFITSTKRSSRFFLINFSVTTTEIKLQIHSFMYVTKYIPQNDIIIPLTLVTLFEA